MAIRESFPTRGVLRRPQLRPVDLLVGAGVLALLYGLVRLGSTVTAPVVRPHVTTKISTDPARLPYYAVRSLLRMFIALVLSVVFTFVYGTAAARCRRAEKVLIPLLDILQSVPILGFLTITVTVVHRPVPGLDPRARVRVDLRHLHVAGVEHDVQLLPLADHPAARARRGGPDDAADEVAAVLAARRAELDDRAGLERDDELRRRLVLPGRLRVASPWSTTPTRCPASAPTSAAAIDEGNLSHVGIAIAVMIVMVIGVNFLFWRPLVAWAERFRVERVRSGRTAPQPRARRAAPLPRPGA